MLCICYVYVKTLYSNNPHPISMKNRNHNRWTTWVGSKILKLCTLTTKDWLLALVLLERSAGQEEQYWLAQMWRSQLTWTEKVYTGLLQHGILIIILIQQLRSEESTESNVLLSYLVRTISKSSSLWGQELKNPQQQ